MVKLVLALVAVAAGRANPVANAFEWADPWAQEVRALLRFEAETIVDVVLNAIAQFGKAADGGPYEGIADADKKKVEDAFVPKCAEKMDELAKRLDHMHLARHGEHGDTLGHSMSTYVRVNCGYLPMDTAQCNKLATELQRLADAGNPMNPFPEENATNETAETAEAEPALLSRKHKRREEPAEEAPAEEAKAEGNSTEPKEPMKDGGEWCTAFFEAFFEGLVKSTTEGAEEEAEEEGLLLMHKFSRTAPARKKKDAWAPMRSLLSHEAAVVTSMLKARGVREAYAKAADADAAKVKEAFQPACADTLQAVADNMMENAANREMDEYLGVSMSTHLQVQCSTTDFPLSEEECDESANELYRLIDEGNPLKVPNVTNETLMPASEEAPAEEAPAEEAPAELVQVGRNDTNGSATEPKVHANGEEWCGDFFERFFAGILAKLEGDKEGEEAAEALLQRLRPIRRA